METKGSVESDPSHKPFLTLMEETLILLLSLKTSGGLHCKEGVDQRNVPGIYREPALRHLSSVPSNGVCQQLPFRSAPSPRVDLGDPFEKHLRDACKLEVIGILAAKIVHDLNNILFAILGNAELALEDIPKNVSLHHKLEQIVKGALRGRDLVKQILTFTRNEGSERQRVHLSSLIKEVHGLLLASLPANITVNLNMPAIDDIVIANAAQMEQVFMNLLTNGVQAMAEGGTLEIGLTAVRFDNRKLLPAPHMRLGDYLVVSVKDTGCGMSKTVKRRIFEPFFTTRGDGAGTGLGLSIAYGIVRSHEGTITVESKPGNGSTFKVYLQRAQGALVPFQERKDREDPITAG